jgi:hypothetical protein
MLAHTECIPYLYAFGKATDQSFETRFLLLRNLYIIFDLDEKINIELLFCALKQINITINNTHDVASLRQL